MSRSGGFRTFVRGGSWVLLLSFQAVSAAAETPAALRFFPVSAFESEGDSIQSGVRVSRGPDGSVRVAEERFESGGAARGVPVPDTLAGGYLFFQPLGSTGGAGTALFRATEWTGALRPLGMVPFTVSEVRTGFDRFYLLGAGRAIALDPDTGTYLPLDPLPPVATILDLEFEPGSGRASLRAPIVGTLVTSDSGLDWQTQPELDGADESNRSPEEQSPGVLPRQGKLAVEVVLRGGTLPGGIVVALVDGERVSLSPERGVLRRVPEPGLDRRARCQALPPGQLADERTQAPLLLWFECRADTGRVELRGYRLPPSAGDSDTSWQTMTLARREYFPATARVLAAGRRGVLLERACTGAPPAKPKTAREFCLVERSGKKTLRAAVSRERSPAGPETFAVGSSAVHHLSLLPDGGIASDRIDAPAKRTVHRIHHEEEIEALVFGGTWLPGASVFEEGISFWATRGESYVGVRLERDSEAARVGAIQRPLRRAFLSGSRALAWGASGFARLSVDSGMTFAEISYPFVSGDQDPSGLTSADQALELGCGPAGCSLGTWLFAGWRITGDGSAQATPPRIAVPPLGGGRFRFICTPTGESSPPDLPGGPEVVENPRTGLQLAPAFWDQAAPRPGKLEAVYSVSDHRVLARLYALGPEEGAWWARGRTSVLFRSPFSSKASLASAPTSDLFADGGEAQTLLGILDRTTQSSQAELDPGGEGGVLSIRTRQQTTLFTFARHDAVQRFDVREDLGLLGLAGAVLSRGTWFVGSIAGGEFRVIELGAGGPRVMATFPLGETGPRQAMLTRTTAGDLGIAIDGDLGLLIHPISAQGALGDTLFEPFRGSRPPECPAEAVGYLVVRELGIAPYVEVNGEELDASSVTMRRVVGFGPECIDALAADARAGFDPALFRATPVRAGGTPLVVTDRSDTGRRMRLSCH